MFLCSRVSLWRWLEKITHVAVLAIGPQTPQKMVRILAAALLGGAAAFAPRAAPATRQVAVFAEDYASMDGPALAAAIDGKRKELFDMRLENRA